MIWEPIAVTEAALWFWDLSEGLIRIDKATGQPAPWHDVPLPSNRVFVSDGSHVY